VYSKLNGDATEITYGTMAHFIK